MLIRTLTKLLVVFCIFGFSISSAFADSMDELLVRSVRNNNISMIQTALSNGADINCTTVRGTTPLLAAIEKRNVHLVNYLLQNGANPNLNAVTRLGILKYIKVPLVEAAHYNKHPYNYEMVQLLVKAGANVNEANENGVTPLMVAVSNPAHIEMIQYLLTNGADVNQAAENGTTPLMIAAKFEGGWGSIDTKTLKLKAAKILLKAGADPSSTDYANKTALQYAVQTDFDAMVNLLLPVSPK